MKTYLETASRIGALLGTAGALAALTACGVGGPPAGSNGAGTTSPVSTTSATAGARTDDSEGFTPGATPTGTSGAGTSSPEATASPTATSTVTIGPDGTVALSAGQEFNLRDSAVAITIQCNGGGEVDVEGSDSEVVIAGNCHNIDIEGTNNTVDIERTDDLRIHADGNTVTTRNLQKLRIESSGNSVTLGTVNEEIRLDSSGNTVTYQQGSPEIRDDGSNTVSRG